LPETLPAERKIAVCGWTFIVSTAPAESGAHKKLARLGGPQLFNVRIADHPGMIGEGYADLRDLPLT
jgi:hypothetical protein